MEFIKSRIEGCYKISPDLYLDNRGCFLETFNQSILENNVGRMEVKQSNLSESQKGVLRGLHFQKGNHSQSKYITAVSGLLMDVVVDCRTYSPSYGYIDTFMLNGDFKDQVYIPKGCAHGFIALSNVIFMYQCDEYYNKESEAGIIWDDEELNIDWILPKDEIIVSQKDLELPSWDDSYKFEIYEK